MLRLAMELVEEAVGTRDPAVVASSFSDRVRGIGASYVQVRRYCRPGGALTSERHWHAGGVLVRDARDGWVGSSGFQYICFDCNPLLDAVTKYRTRYRFSDFASHTDRRYGDYWDALRSAAIADSWGANAYGPDGAVASVHIGLDATDVEPSVGAALQTAGGIVAEHLLAIDAPFPPVVAKTVLTQRERDVMRFVADGKTDWEIGVILGVAEATARFHADNARRKLHATNRAHAVARFMAGGG